MDATAIFGVLWIAPCLISINRSNGRSSITGLWMMLATAAGIGTGAVVALIVKTWVPIFAGIAAYYFVFYKLDNNFASFVDQWIFNKK